MASLTIKTDESLLEKITRSARQKLSADELQKQRVSFIYAGLPRGNGITKVEIEKILRDEKSS